MEREAMLKQCENRFFRFLTRAGKFGNKKQKVRVGGGAFIGDLRVSKDLQY